MAEGPGFPEASSPGPAPPDAALARRVTALLGHSPAVAAGGHLLLPSRLIPSPRKALGPRRLGLITPDPMPAWDGAEGTPASFCLLRCAGLRLITRRQGRAPSLQLLPFPLPGPSPFPVLATVWSELAWIPSRSSPSAPPALQGGDPEGGSKLLQTHLGLGFDFFLSCQMPFCIHSFVHSFTHC